MAHLIELTDSNTLEKMLFNLDTVVSIERTSGSNTTSLPVGVEPM